MPIVVDAYGKKIPISKIDPWEYVKLKIRKEGKHWIWYGKISKQGYGQLPKDMARKVGSYQVHRFTWSHENGPIPDGHTIEHKCNIRRCVNPACLTPMTLRDNLILGSGKSPAKINFEKTHCVRGHSYSGDNLVMVKNKGKLERRCRTCSREYFERTTGKKRGVSNKDKTHCKHGHSLSGDNLVIVNSGRSRLCKICRNEYMRQYYHRKRQNIFTQP